MNKSSSPMYSRPSLLEGIARSIDFGGTLNTYHIEPFPEVADQIALAWDWAIVGQSLQDALDTTPKPNGKHLSPETGSGQK